VAISKKVLGPEDPNLVNMLTNLAYLYVRLGDSALAWQHQAQASAGSGRQLEALLAVSADSEHAAISHGRREDFEVLLSLAAFLPALTPEQRRELLAQALTWKAGSGRALTLRQEALAMRQADPDITAQYTELQRDRQLLANLLLRGPGREGTQRYRQQLDELRQSRDRLERALARQVAAFAAVQQARTAGPTDVAGRLPAGAILIELVKYDRFNFQHKAQQKGWAPARYAALLMERPATANAGPSIRFLDLGDAQPIDAAIHAWRTAAQKGAIPERIDRELRDLLWTPLARQLPAGTTRLILAPDGETALVPFEAIRLANDKYLVEHYHVSYVSSGRDLMPRPLPTAPGPALVLADPDYDALGEAPKDGVSATGPRFADAKRSAADFRKQQQVFQRLPGFAAEAAGVRKTLQKHRPDWPLELRQQQHASEEVLQAIRRPRLLYLITHGFFLPDLERPKDDRTMRGLEVVSLDTGRARLPSFGEDPRLRSGLALAGANHWQQRSERGQSDGLLTAREVENLDLFGTELVVLSACETGLGQVQVGEGVLGLRRAFQAAGARTVLASLWKVPDNETEKLMTRFFQLWLSAGKVG
jgi:CHAT domain-containing protein